MAAHLAVDTVFAADNSGCRCGDSRCLKLYCKCFRAVKECGKNCKCKQCGNSTENSEERDRCVISIRLKDHEVRVRVICVLRMCVCCGYECYGYMYVC